MNRNYYKGIIKIITLIPFIVVALFLACCDANSTEKVPVITSFTPLRGRIDTIITITGENFSAVDAENIVRLNGVMCPKIFSSTELITIKAIPGINTGRISVTVGNLAAISSEDFTLAAHSFIFNPYNGKAGDVVNFTGYNFSDLDDKITIKFDTLSTSIYDYITVSDTIKSFKAKVPTGAYTGNVVIEIASVKIQSDTVFTINE